MPQLTHSQPQILMVSSRTRRFLAVAAVIAGVATSALLVISEQDKGPPPGGVVSDSPSAGVSHDGGYYRTLSRRATLSDKRPDGTRYDGGPEEGTRDAALALQPRIRYDGGPEEGTRGALTSDAPARPCRASATTAAPRRHQAQRPLAPHPCRRSTNGPREPGHHATPGKSSLFPRQGRQTIAP
jgi:hypothetical protein